MKIITVIGARPQFIKAAVVSRCLQNVPDISEVIIHTGQHFDDNMSQVFFEEMNIPHPAYNLNINGLKHGAMTGRMMTAIEEIILKEKPDIVLVYGDTNSTLAGALTAVKLNIKTAHVEAGLRSYNREMPEEINRIVTDRISDILFCPTESAKTNLDHEGISNSYVVGDVMYDAALYYSNKARRPQAQGIPQKYILSTIHRAENTDDPEILNNIFAALETISEVCSVVIPLHPRTKSRLEAANYDFDNSKIVFIPPVGYLEMIWLIKNCEIVMTDSGGLQKEAYFFKKHCVVLRNETEWTELVEYGYNCLAGTEKDKIISYTENMMNKKEDSFNIEFYGNGKTGEKIISFLRHDFVMRTPKI